MGILKKCLHQILRPSKPNPLLKREGVGDCYTCQTHEDNKFCICYAPVSDFQTFKVKKNEDKS